VILFSSVLLTSEVKIIRERISRSRVEFTIASGKARDTFVKAGEGGSRIARAILSAGV
jgi:hypothetical protein